MLTPDDRRAIEGLFERLAQAERQAPDRDHEAEDLIRREIARHPAAPYYMAQTIVVQQQALEMAERRIEDLERAASRRERGGLFGGLFDDGRGRQDRDGGRAVQRGRGGPWDQQDAVPRQDQRNPQQQGGGGFLAGAAQTALGVAGGVLLGSAIASMFGAGAAHASESQSQDQNGDSGQSNDQDSNHDNSDAGQDGGGDFGGDGGFDMGGDF